MYPTISDLINDLFGIYIPLPIQTFGFFVAIAFLLASYTLGKELRRKESEGLLKPVNKKFLKGAPVKPIDVFYSAVIGALLGYKLVDMIMNYTEFVNNPQAFVLSFRGNFFGIFFGAAVGFYLKYIEKRKEQKSTPTWENRLVYPHEHVGNMTLIAALAGIIGAKIFHNLENPGEFIDDPLGALLSFSGLTMYGGLICGAIAVIWYGKRNGVAPLHLIDAAAPGLMLAYGVGRIGCHVSGDGDWGQVNLSPMPSWLNWLPDWLWSYDYPNNVIREGVPIPGCEGTHCFVLPEPVWPTPLYEAIAGILLFFVLWGLRKHIKIPGLLFAIYLIMNGVERFFIEKIRVNETYNIFGFQPTQAEIISVMMIILGIAGMIYLVKKDKEKPVA
jgi:phosphatidylglycerol---prolipoprotein diacylglyceryl transferase